MADDIAAEVRKIVGHPFEDRDLLRDALTHSSLPNENAAVRRENRRLAHLGDAVVELYVRDALYRRFPEASKGQLSKTKTTLVSNEALARLPAAQALAALLRRGGSLQSALATERMRAEVLEAVMGAVYLERGMAGASKALVGCLPIPDALSE